MQRLSKPLPILRRKLEMYSIDDDHVMLLSDGDHQPPSSRPVPHVRRDASLARTAAVLRDSGTDAAVVIDLKARAVAMVTARGICLTALRANKPLSDLTVEQAMTRTLGGDTVEEEALLRKFVRYATQHARSTGCATSASVRRAVSGDQDIKRQPAVEVRGDEQRGPDERMAAQRPVAAKPRTAAG